MLRVKEGRGPRSRLGVVIAQVRVNLSILTGARRIDYPDALYSAPVHNPANDEFTGAVRCLPVLRKVGVFDIPGSDQAAKEFRMIAQCGMRAYCLECCNHSQSRVGRGRVVGICRCRRGGETYA